MDISRWQTPRSTKKCDNIGHMEIIGFPVSGAGDSRAGFCVLCKGGRGMGLISIHFRRRAWLLRLLGALLSSE